MLQLQANGWAVLMVGCCELCLAYNLLPYIQTALELGPLTLFLSLQAFYQYHQKVVKYPLPIY